MIATRWIAASVCLAAASWICLVNAIVVARFLVSRRRSSMIPLVGSIIGVVALKSMPIHGVGRFWWLPIVLDAGSGIWLVSLAFLGIHRAWSKRPHSK
jgi:hypothetical protein